MSSIDDKKAWLLELNAFVKDLVPEIRAQAFEILANQEPIGVNRSDIKHDESESMEAFFADIADAKPSDAALAIAAYWFSQYGATPFSRSWVEDTASRVGVTIPARVDMTLRQARRDGKALFRVSQGTFVPTVHGERYLKREFQVSKGTDAPPSEEDE